MDQGPQRLNPQHHGGRGCGLVAELCIGHLCPGGVVVKEASGLLLVLLPEAGRAGVKEADLHMHERPIPAPTSDPRRRCPSSASTSTLLPVLSHQAFLLPLHPGPWPGTQIPSLLPSRFTLVTDRRGGLASFPAGCFLEVSRPLKLPLHPTQPQPVGTCPTQPGPAQASAPVL